MLNSTRSRATPPLRVHTPTDASVIILGAGFGGLCMAIKLWESGQRDFLVLEKAGSLGGTWRDNTYPGCACDIPSHLYSYSFAQASGWSRRYAAQAEILAYIQETAKKYRIEDRVVYHTKVTTAAWDESGKYWRLSTAARKQFTAEAVVSAVGGLHIPSYPALAGLHRFNGACFHTAEWRHDVDLTNKAVAVIGAGASAVQLVPEVATKAKRLHVFQRSPQWIMPRRDRSYGILERLAYRYVPGILRASRAFHYWKAEATALGFVIKPKWMREGEKRARKFLEQSVADLELRGKLTPDYRMGCKRILLSDSYYPALQMPNVELVTDPISQVTEDGIVTSDATKRAVDVIICATGFHPFNQADGMSIIGRSGRRLADEWKNGPEAYRGVAVTGFPNFFMIMGPNSGLGHNSIVFMIESQVRYIRRCLAWLHSGSMDTVEVRAEIQEQYNRDLERARQKTVWGDRQAGKQCSSWYVHAKGRNTAIWPGFSTAYWMSMLRVERNDFLEPRPRTADAPVLEPLRRAA